MREREREAHIKRCYNLLVNELVIYSKKTTTTEKEEKIERKKTLRTWKLVLDIRFGQRAHSVNNYNDNNNHIVTNMIWPSGHKRRTDRACGAPRAHSSFFSCILVDPREEKSAREER